MMAIGSDGDDHGGGDAGDDDATQCFNAQLDWSLSSTPWPFSHITATVLIAVNIVTSVVGRNNDDQKEVCADFVRMLVPSIE